MSVALVTGAGSGIGRAIARRLHDESWRVGALDIDSEGLVVTVGPRPSDRMFAVKADVTDLEAIEKAVAEVAANLGPITALVNSAGWEKRRVFAESAPSDWERMIAVNFLGVLNCSRAVLASMAEGGGGRIVSVSSDAGRVGSSQEAVYSGTKAAVIGFSKGLAREVARLGITVNVVAPGPTDTPMLRAAGEENPRLNEALERAIPMRRVAEPDEIAVAVSFFLSPDASYITGQTLSVSGGLTMM